MNRKIAIALAVAAAAATSFAADDGMYEPSGFAPAKTRAQVITEMQDARQAVNPYADEYNPVHHMRSERTRDEVTREYLPTRDAVSALGAEDSGSAYLARQGGGAPSQPTQAAIAPSGFAQSGYEE